MSDSYTSSKTSPQKLLVAGFLITIFIGTGLLLMPFSTTEGISFLDAFFTSTSAVCVTGLIVKNTPADFTAYGEAIILALIQIGGLGYMSMATLVALMVGKKIGLKERILIKESLNIATHEGIVKFMKGMLLFVLAAEGLGTAVLFAKFVTRYDMTGALFKALFHSISAFNNAGFSLFENSLMDYRGDPVVNFTIMTLIVFGGIGFTVVDDLYGWFTEKRRNLMIHTRIVLTSTAVLIAAGLVLVYISESRYLFTRQDISIPGAVMASLFASVTARTAGFNTLDYSLLQPATLFLTIILMFIGASPGSTGGGIKNTTFSVVIIHLWSTIRGKSDAVAFKRTIPPNLVSKSLVIMSLAVIYSTLVTFIIVDIEHTPFLQTLFEAVSAFGTVGLSVGDGGARSLCATFSDLSKSIIIFTMFLGRLGPLTLFMAMVEQKEQRVRYPEGKVMIG